MKIRLFTYFFLIGVYFVFQPVNLYAARPLWSLTPLTATTVTVSSDGSAIIQYTVTNQASRTFSLAMKSIQGITQNTSGPGICARVFSLSPNQSCVLSLFLDGSALPPSITGGPAICQTNSNGTPNPNACYQPSRNEQLNITKRNIIPIEASVSTMALSVNCPTPSVGCTSYNAALTGQPRIITVTNHSTTETAFDVSYAAAPELPSGTSITPQHCNIAPLGNCVFTITPGQIPSASPGDTSPVPITLTIAGNNTSTLSILVNILTYGSVYQSGYVFSVNDATSNTESISGTIAALSDASTAIPWQPDCPTSSCTPTNANDSFNGALNTASIVSTFNNTLQPNEYAGGRCAFDTTGGYSNWYLPAICELGYGDNSSSTCGDITNPAIQNMQSNLSNQSIGGLIDRYWSSTQTPGLTLTHANANIFDGTGSQGGELKEEFLYLRCARGFS